MSVQLQNVYSQFINLHEIIISLLNSITLIFMSRIEHPRNFLLQVRVVMVSTRFPSSQPLGATPHSPPMFFFQQKRYLPADSFILGIRTDASLIISLRSIVFLVLVLILVIFIVRAKLASRTSWIIYFQSIKVLLCYSYFLLTVTNISTSFLIINQL